MKNSSNIKPGVGGGYSNQLNIVSCDFLSTRSGAALGSCSETAGTHKSRVRASYADATVWRRLKVDSLSLYILRSEIAASFVFTWPKASKMQSTFMRKTGDGLKTDPARRPLMSTKHKITHILKTFRLKNWSKCPPWQNAVIPILRWLLLFKTGVPTKNSTGVCAAAHGGVWAMLKDSRHERSV